MMRLARGAPRFLDGTPNGEEIIRARNGSVVAANGIERGFNLLPASAFHGLEEALDIVGHGHLETFGQRVNEFAAILAELNDFLRDNLFGCGSRRAGGSGGAAKD